MFTYSPAQHRVFFGSRIINGERKNRRIFPKGRRFGMTRGAAHAMMEFANQGEPILWGDTIAGNIQKYVARYFLPAAKKVSLKINWKVQERILEVGSNGGYIDFRSADRPENWEGFGYKKVFLNEAGIILKDRYLYENAVLPMLLDYPDAELIAAGTPKGKLAPDGKHVFFELYENAIRGEKGYHTETFHTRENAISRGGFLDDDSIEEFISTYPIEAASQEIEGKFSDQSEGQWTVIPRAWLDLAVKRWQALELEGNLPTGIFTALGVDVARGGSDSTVLAPAVGDVILPLITVPGVATPDGRSVQKLVLNQNRFGDNTRANIDVIGLGSSPHDYLKEVHANTFAMNASEKSLLTSKIKTRDGTLGFLNKRAEWYWTLRERLDPENGATIALPPDETLLEDLNAPYYTIKDRIQIEEKKEIKKRLGRSPDRGDAVVYALAIMKQTILFGETGNPWS